MSSAVDTERVRAATRAGSVEPASTDGLLDLLPASTGALAWLQDGDGLVGWGETARLEVSGPDRFAVATRWWADFVARLDSDDGCTDTAADGGPVAFGSFAFDDASTTPSVLVVPRVLVRRRHGATSVTTIGPEPAVRPAARRRRAPRGIRYSTGEMSVTSFRTAVEAAVRRIRAGELAKVVLAYDLLARADDELDVRAVLHRLSGAYPRCWTFAVEGLVGATPELLVRRTGTSVASRVLAGTAVRGGDPVEDEARRDALAASAKDAQEHRYAVESVTRLLGPWCAEMTVPAEPGLLQLANAWHLATDVAGRLRDPVSALELAGALHPTAAVGGTPSEAAKRVRAELESLDRGRYAGPVGWVDARGDGEWGLALRCAQVDGATARLFAGCGIVAESDPDDEVREADAKFLPVREALEGAG